MLAHPMKRARSNSPPTSPNGISSPLDILLKRRRRNELIESLGWGGQEGLYLPTQQQSESGHGDWQVSPDRRRDEDENVNGIAGPSRFACHGEFAADHPTISDGSRNIESTEMGVERRRRRQWEKAQAPPPYYYNPSGTSHRHSQGTSETPPNPASFHSPIPINNSQSHGNNGYDRNQSNGRHEMSSSPIRNHPPGSSPFRANVAENGHGNEGYGDLDWEHEMSIEEMRREWGDEYASQNTLLHSLVSFSFPLERDFYLFCCRTVNSVADIRVAHGENSEYPTQPSSSDEYPNSLSVLITIPSAHPIKLKLQLQLSINNNHSTFDTQPPRPSSYWIP